MYVRLITFHLKPDVSNQDAAAVYDTLSALLKKQEGFQGMAGMINEETCQAVSLSFWQDQAAATEAGSRSLPALMENVQELVDRPLEISGYHLVSGELPAA